MLTEWVIRNFKSFNRETPAFELSNLNLVCGANSSGKSSLLQSILLVAQTLSSPTSNRSLVLNGELVKLGYPEDIIHLGDVTNAISVRFTYPLTRHDTHELYLRDAPQVNRMGESSTKGRVQVGANFRITSGDRSRILLVSTRVRAQDYDVCVSPANTEDRLSTQYQKGSPMYVTPDLKARILRGEFDYLIDDATPLDVALSPSSRLQYGSMIHFLPNRALRRYNVAEEILRDALTYVSRRLRSFGGQMPGEVLNVNFRDSSGLKVRNRMMQIINDEVRSRSNSRQSGLVLQRVAEAGTLLGGAESLEEWIESLRNLQPAARSTISDIFALAASRREMSSKGSFEDSDIVGLKVAQFYPDIDVGLRGINGFFTQRLRYLGPLRDDPRMIYGLPPIPESKDIGIKGEYTAAVLERFGNEQVQCPLPPSGIGDRPSYSTMSLLEGISLWLKHMGMVNSVETQDRGKMGVELTVSSPEIKKRLDLTNVGVGVSQVLPLLAICLLAPDDSLILLEQPELHLHPKVQSILGDFFLGICSLNKQCIVETHSERLINRIRARIAEGESDSIMRLVRIYFVEKTGPATSVIPVIPNEYGAIPDWPRGFFDDGPDEAQRIIEAATHKRMLKHRTVQEQKRGAQPR